MARDRERGEDSKPTYPAGRVEVEGNLTRDPKDVTRGESTVVSLTVAANYRTFTGEEGAHFFNVTCFGTMAQRVLDDLGKGDRVIVTGTLFGHEWESDNGTKHELDIRADSVGLSLRFSENGGGSRRPSSRRTSRDEVSDEEPRTSRRTSRDADEEPRTSRRTSRDEVSDEPATSRRTSRDEVSDEEPRTSRRTSSRRTSRVEEAGENVDYD